MMESQNIVCNLDSEQLITSIECVKATSSRSTSTATVSGDSGNSLDVDVNDTTQQQAINPIAISPLITCDGTQQTGNNHCHLDNNDAFGQFNYITQGYSNLVFYNGPTMVDAGGDNYQFFNNGSSIDFPFITTDTLPMPSDKFQLEDNIQYFNLLHHANAAITNEINQDDLPEYIDINSLVIPTHCFPTCPDVENLSNNKMTIKLETNATIGNNAINNEPQQASQCLNGINNVDKNGLGDDVDVVFVKEYKCETAKSITHKRKIPNVATETAPRRNPKRQVQMQKASYELATKLSMEGCCNVRRCTTTTTTRDLSSMCSTSMNTRRSTRVTGAVFSPPTTFKTSDYKEWPVDGMHEKPTFNPVTKKIDKLPSTPKKIKVPNGRTRKRTTSAARQKKESADSKQSEYEAKKSFATMTHHNLHYVLSYVNSVKEYNARIGKPNCDPFLHDNVVKAGDLLSDACILYCIANDVSETSLANYLSAVTVHDNVTEFLECVVDGCESNPISNTQ